MDYRWLEPNKQKAQNQNLYIIKIINNLLQRKEPFPLPLGKETVNPLTHASYQDCQQTHLPSLLPEQEVNMIVVHFT